MIEFFVSYYDPETKAVRTGLVDARVLKDARMNLAMSHEVDANHQIDDEFARRVGGAALLWFATQYPELREHLMLTDGNGNKVTL